MSNYYPQPVGIDEEPARPQRTMTVAELIDALLKLDVSTHKLPVCFETPEHGCFGPEEMYSVAGLEERSFEGSVVAVPPGFGINEETGERESYRGWTEVRAPWKGIVIR